MPQTLEHLQILDLLGLDRGIIALTKADVVSSERLSEVARQMLSLLAGTRLTGAEIIPVSSITGEGVAEVQDRRSLRRQPRSGMTPVTTSVWRLIGASRCPASAPS